MSSTPYIEMVYSPDDSDALSSSDLSKTTNGEILKMLLEMKKQPKNGDLFKMLCEIKKQNTDLVTQVKKNGSEIYNNGTQNDDSKLYRICVIFYFINLARNIILFIMAVENNRGLFHDDDTVRCGN